MFNGKLKEKKTLSDWKHDLSVLTDAQIRFSMLGGEITLSCENLEKNQQRCQTTTWMFSNLNPTVELVVNGQIKSHKPGRLSLGENYSLTIRNLRDEDAGLYTCRQFDSSGGKIGTDTAFDVSVVNSE